jgi:hypothetical protein
MKAIGIAIIVLLAVIAIQLSDIRQSTVDTSPGWHTVIPCPDMTDDGLYNPPQGYCDDPNTTD